jgi:MoxR-like ATPase
MQEAVRKVLVKRDVAEYLLRLVAATRNHPRFALGVSTRGALACFRAAQARAFSCGRSYVSPDDFQRLAVPAMAHRVQLTAEARYGGESTEAILAELVAELPVPL